MFLDVGLPTRLRFDLEDGPFPYPDDGYPAIIVDAAVAYGATSAAEVRRCWAQTCDPLPDPREVVPYINRGRWLADCPDCNMGFYVWDQMPSGCHLRCGRVFKVLWQFPKLRSEAVRLLAVRPRENRNWNAHKGETVGTLEFENRWFLGDVNVKKNGVLMPSSLVLPDAFTDKRG